jgi:hypothetical protein
MTSLTFGRPSRRLADEMSRMDVVLSNLNTGLALIEQRPDRCMGQ